MKTTLTTITALILIAILTAASGAAAETGPETPYTTFLPVALWGDPPRWIGPDGGNIVAVVIDPANTSTLYAGTFGAGIFKSVDGGVSWAPSNQGLGNLYIQSIAVHPTYPSILYAGTYKTGQVFKSIDYGETWFSVSEGIQAEAVIYSIAIDAVFPQTVYIATRGISNNNNPPWRGVIYKSTDGGTTWRIVLQNVGGVEQQDWAYSLFVSPINTSLVMAAFHEFGPYTSYNYGENWNPANNIDSIDASGRFITAVATSPYPTAFLGVWHGGGVYRSDDTGGTWLHKAAGLEGTKVYGLAIDRYKPYTVYAATYLNGMYKTTTNGVTWLPSGLANERLYNVIVNPQATLTVFAGTGGNGLFRSVDGGNIWAHSQRGLYASTASGMGFDPLAPGAYLAASFGGGVRRSTDEGRTWNDLSTGLGSRYVYALVQSPVKPSVFFALTDLAGLYRLDLSSGSTWSKVSGGLQALAEPSLSQSEPEDVKVSLVGGPYVPYGPEHPFAPLWVLESDAEEPQLWAETDSAKTSLPNLPLLDMVFAPSRPSTVYLATSGEGVYRSADGGEVWAPAGLSGQVIWSVAVHPAQPDTVYAAPNTIGNLFMTTNGGSSWSSLPVPGLAVYSLAFSPEEPAVLYAGTTQGLRKATSSGGWAEAGLTGKPVTAIAFHPTGVLFAGTSGKGAFYSLDGGITWISAGLPEGIAVSSINFDPEVTGRVYFNTQTHGVFRMNYLDRWR